MEAAMTMTQRIPLIMLLTAAAFVSVPFPACAAGSPAQTILNPAVPRKSQYPRVVIYTVSWCPHCRELKEYLTSRNIPFINRDVELEPAAMEELVQKYSTYGVPVIVIGNDQEIVKGFTGELFEAAVARVRKGSNK
jgi:glutaredoxin 3